MSRTSLDMRRRSFLKLTGSILIAAPLAISACSQQSDSATPGPSTTQKQDISGEELTFVGDNAFAPYRSVEVQRDGSQKVVGLDIAITDEMSQRLGFSYDFEAQEFAATLATIQNADTAFTMAMAENDERKKTYDFTRGYYQPRVGVLALDASITTIDELRDRSIACTTGTVQNRFITQVLPDADIHTYNGGTQCLQDVLAGRVSCYLCDGAEGKAMAEANPGLQLGLLERSATKDYVGVYRIMARKGADFVSAFDSCIKDMLDDGTIDSFITQYVGADFTWGDDTSESGSSTLSS